MKNVGVFRRGPLCSREEERILDRKKLKLLSKSDWLIYACTSMQYRVGWRIGLGVFPEKGACTPEAVLVIVTEALACISSRSTSASSSNPLPRSQLPLQSNLAIPSRTFRGSTSGRGSSFQSVRRRILSPEGKSSVPTNRVPNA